MSGNAPDGGVAAAVAMGRVVGLDGPGNRTDAGVSMVGTEVGGAGSCLTVAVAARTEGAGAVVGEAAAAGWPVCVATSAGNGPLVAIGVDGVAASTAVALSRGGWLGVTGGAPVTTGVGEEVWIGRCVTVA